MTDAVLSIYLAAYNSCAVGYHSYDGCPGWCPNGTTRLCPAPPER